MDQQPNHHSHADQHRLTAVEQDEERKRPHYRRQCTADIHRTTAEAIRQCAKQRYCDGVAYRPQHGGTQRQRARQIQHGGDVGQREHDHQRIEHVRADTRSAGDQQRTHVLREDFAHRRLRNIFRRLQLQKCRRLTHTPAQPQTEDDQHQTQQERNPPAPLLKIVRRHRQRHQRNEACADQRTAGRSYLSKGRVAPALMRLTVFHRQQYRTRPFSAQRNALNKAQRHQQQWAPNPPAGVAGQQPHQRRGHAHDHQRGDQYKAPSQHITKVAEYDATDRPGNIAHRVSGESQNRAHQWIERWEEYMVENQRGHDVVDGEIVPFQRRTDRAGRRKFAGIGRCGGTFCGRCGNLCRFSGVCIHDVSSCAVSCQPRA